MLVALKKTHMIENLKTKMIVKIYSGTLLKTGERSHENDGSHLHSRSGGSRILNLLHWFWPIDGSNVAIKKQENYAESRHIRKFSQKA